MTSLIEVLTHPITQIQKIKNGKKGSTYVKIKCRKDLPIPQSPKKDWRCVFLKVHESPEGSGILYDDFSDEIMGFHGEQVPSEHCIVEMIFKESMFDFFHNKLLCDIQTKFSYENHTVVSYDYMKLCDDVVYCDRANAKPTKVTRESREFFIHALLTHEKYHTIIRGNHLLLERCRYSEDVLVAKTAKSFSLAQFYTNHIGNVIALDKLPWDNLNLSLNHLIDMAMDSLPPTKQTVATWRAISERFEHC